jgi:hypothetical protein
MRCDNVDQLRSACREVAGHLPGTVRVPHPPAMFVVSEEAAAAIRTAFDQEGELSVAIELRRLFPGITDNAKARDCARAIAGWTPLPPMPEKKPRTRQTRTRSSTSGALSAR